MNHVEFPNGNLVCADHHLELCGICCLDFTEINAISQERNDKGKKYYTDSFGFRYCKDHDCESCKKCGVNEVAYNKKIEAKEKEKKKPSQTNNNNNNNSSRSKDNHNHNTSTKTTTTSKVTSSSNSNMSATTTTMPSSDEDDDGMPSLVSESDLEYCEEKRKEGNEHFAKSNYQAALKSYSDGIRRDPYSLTLLANRSACYLNLHNPAEALKDAEKVCAIDRDHVKANSRRIKSLVLLGRLSEAKPLLAEARAYFSGDTASELDTLIRRAESESTQARQQQQQPPQAPSQPAAQQPTQQLSKKQKKKMEKQAQAQAQAQKAQQAQSGSQTPSQPAAQQPTPTPTPTSAPSKEPPAKKEEDPISEEAPRAVNKDKKLECIICMENDVQLMLRPCGHAVLCKECYKRLPEKICPIDRTPIKRTFSVYL